MLLFAFYGALLWALWTGNASNPLFESLNIEASGLKDLLLVLTNVIFGGLALTFLVTTFVYILRWSLAKSTDANKGSLLTRMVVYLVLFFCELWFLGFPLLLYYPGVWKRADGRR